MLVSVLLFIFVFRIFFWVLFVFQKTVKPRMFRSLCLLFGAKACSISFSFPNAVETFSGILSRENCFQNTPIRGTPLKLLKLWAKDDAT